MSDERVDEAVESVESSGWSADDRLAIWAESRGEAVSHRRLSDGTWVTTVAFTWHAIGKRDFNIASRPCADISDSSADVIASLYELFGPLVDTAVALHDAQLDARRATRDSGQV